MSSVCWTTLGDAALEGEPGLLEQVGAAVVGAVLLEGRLGVGVDRACHGVDPVAVRGIGDHDGICGE